MYHVGGNSYELLTENKNGWNLEAFRERFSDVLERYDYIVGDWGYNQLRLRGFFKENNAKGSKDFSFTTVQDYLNEYCNFGCAYFIIEKLGSRSQRHGENGLPDGEQPFPFESAEGEQHEPVREASRETTPKSWNSREQKEAGREPKENGKPVAEKDAVHEPGGKEGGREHQRSYGKDRDSGRDGHRDREPRERHQDRHQNDRQAKDHKEPNGNGNREHQSPKNNRQHKEHQGHNRHQGSKQHAGGRQQQQSGNNQQNQQQRSQQSQQSQQTQQPNSPIGRPS